MRYEPQIEVTVPAALEYKNLVLRSVTAACEATREPPSPETNIDGTPTDDLADPFTAEAVSAVSELINNIVIHGHCDRQGTITAKIRPSYGFIEIELLERGRSVDLDLVQPPDLDSQPENGMGLFIVRACVDSLEYEPGATNRWCLTKYRYDAGSSLRMLTADHLAGQEQVPAPSQPLSSTPPLAARSRRYRPVDERRSPRSRRTSTSAITLSDTAPVTDQ